MKEREEEEEEEEKLKYCPFCGGIPIQTDYLRFGFAIKCSKCGAMTARFDVKSDAEKAWNRRKEK